MGRGIDADRRDLLDPFDVELAYMLGAHDRMADACHALLERRIPSWSRSHWARRSGQTERAVIDVDSDPLYDPFVREVAQTLDEGFRGLLTLGQLEDVMLIVWQTHGTHREASFHG